MDYKKEINDLLELFRNKYLPSTFFIFSKIK